MLKTVPRPRRAKPDKYGETKQRYQIMLTETASNELDKVAEDLGITRSELFERLIRQGFLKAVQAEADEEEV